MPSGAKKRKAAAKKKKEENHPNNESRASSASTHSHGNADVKQQDDKEDDIGNVNSAPLEVKEEQIPKGRNVSDLPSRNKSRIDIGGKSLELGEGVIQDERHVKIENGSDGKDERIEHFEAERKSYNGGSRGSSMSSRSSTSSSDSENHGIKGSQATVDIASVADSLPGVSVEDNIQSAPMKDHVAGNVPGSDLDRNSEQAKVEAVFIEDSTSAPCVIQSVLQENGEERLIHAEEKVDTPEQITNAASEREGEEIIHSVENISAPYEPKEQEILHENEHRSSIPQCAPAAAAHEGATNEALLVPSIAQPMQQTSWKSCCGLFDVFSGAGA